MATHQRRIGLTGGIATGKSTVAQLLQARFAVPVLDADLFAREALAPGTAGSQAVVARFGTQVLVPRQGEDGGAEGAEGAAADPAETLDRRALGRLVFSDPVERRWLEGLVHPLVRQRFTQELAGLAEEPAVVLMIPLLFEAGLESLCSEIWLVDCEPAEQRARLLARDGTTAADADARIAAQWPLERKRSLADVLIDNRQGAESLASQLGRALGLEATGERR
ncbi:dephospho-CoA kinase [Synechococcus sp. Lug-A]|uniref:dephospho-CoA kinase n=1 Tax=unclassified Synechococcus TaxID=2626047 RepID=UPI0020CE4C86|nr:MULTISPECIES: dephospho-CoA kinase [unclassified Synechococcus]MCP9827997.1 dephospho-CoA kinase [Synechococcus sp. L2F]MCP9848056.1 dephospho-CoA kinase [Synechococcus sp. Lug-A]